jgi:hypothetical protein
MNLYRYTDGELKTVEFISEGVITYLIRSKDYPTPFRVSKRHWYQTELNAARAHRAECEDEHTQAFQQLAELSDRVTTMNLRIAALNSRISELVQE